MSWLKERIGSLIVTVHQNEPYSFWHSNLFQNVDGAALEGCIDQRLVLLQLFSGTWERVERTVELWSDVEALSAVKISRQLSHLYLCLLYPRETLLVDLARQLPPDSLESKLCVYYGGPESDYRHIRNALAHGSFAHEGYRIAFYDRDWSLKLSTKQLELD